MISDTSPPSQKLIVLKVWSTAPRFSKVDPAQGSPCTWFSSAPGGALKQVEPEHRQSLMAFKAVCQRSGCNRLALMQHARFEANYTEHAFFNFTKEYFKSQFRCVHRSSASGSNQNPFSHAIDGHAICQIPATFFSEMP